MVESKSGACVPCSSPPSSLRSILDLWDRYESIASEDLADDERRARLADIDASLDVAAKSDAGAIGTLVRDESFSHDELRIVLLLLRRLLSESGPSCKGKRILQFLFPGTFDMLVASRLLDPEATLLSRGIVECAAPGAGPAVLEGEYRLSESFFARLRGDLLVASPQRGSKKSAEKGTGKSTGKSAKKAGKSGEENGDVASYADNLEYLLDLKSLAMSYRRRAESIFRGDDVDVPRAGAVTEGAARELGRKRDAVKARLAHTKDAERFPAVRFQQRYRLTDEEMILVTALLFQEIHTGNAFADAIDLVKLVSDCERDLVLKRALLGERGALVREEILSIDDAGESEICGEVSLSGWAFETILGEIESDGADAGDPGRTGAIDADVRLDFHQYIQGIRDSGDFFAKLELPPGRDPAE